MAHGIGTPPWSTESWPHREPVVFLPKSVYFRYACCFYYLGIKKPVKSNVKENCFYENENALDRLGKGK